MAGEIVGAGIGVEIVAVEEERQRIPDWLGEAMLLGQYWQESGLVGYLGEAVRVVRGRMGQYEVVDFVLLLNSYAISGERTLADFYQSLAPFREVLMGVWGRSQCPSAASLSRFLAAVDARAVRGLRGLFESDLERNGIEVTQGIGLFDRAADHYVVFDVDGTVSAARQRAVERDQGNYPPVRRRSNRACAPGYKGRKRGEVSRTRPTIAVAQTSEWLGTYGGSGNGDAKGELAQSCRVIQHYLADQGLNVAHGLVRLDGLYGTASLVSIVQQAGLGYILRCRDYPLLKEAAIAERLEKAAAGEWEALGGNSFSEILDVGYVEELKRGYATPMRVIVIRTPEKLHQARIGKRMKTYVYELFATSQSVASLSALDVISVYRGRGGFEQQLSQEDQEQDYDRWCSWHPEGQEFWQILGQWSWNWRVWMGWQQRPSVRQTIWAEAASDKGAAFRVGLTLAKPERPALPPSLRQTLQPRRNQTAEAASPESATPFSTTSETESRDRDRPIPATDSQGETGDGIAGLLTSDEGDCSRRDRSGSETESRESDRYGPMEVSTEWGRGLGKRKRFGNEDFRIVDEQTVLCPAGHALHQRSKKVKANGDLAMQFGIKPRICQSCPLKRQCLAPHSKGVGGRRVTVIQRALSTATAAVDPMSAIVRSAIQWLIEPQPQYQRPIFWCDIKATQLRRSWHEDLSRQVVEITTIAGGGSVQPGQPLLSRAQREHRRLSWRERWERNERKATDPRWNLVLYRGKAISEGMRVISRRSFNLTG